MTKYSAKLNEHQDENKYAQMLIGKCLRFKYYKHITRIDRTLLNTI